MKSIDKQGLVKFDFLGLKTLTILRECRQTLSEQGVAVPELRDIPLDDQSAYSLLGSKEALGLFQIYADCSRDLMVMLKPDCFAHVVAFIAIYRWAALQNGVAHEYLGRRNGEVAAEYLHPDLQDILAETYGVIIFQEQVMQIAMVMAGYTPGQADLLRRAISSHSYEVAYAQEDAFVAGMVSRGYARDLAENLFSHLARHAWLSFIKSHCVAYATLMYQTAWFKAHYPREYAAAVDAHK